MDELSLRALRTVTWGERYRAHGANRYRALFEAPLYLMGRPGCWGRRWRPSAAPTCRKQWA